MWTPSNTNVTPTSHMDTINTNFNRGQMHHGHILGNTPARALTSHYKNHNYVDNKKVKFS